MLSLSNYFVIFASLRTQNIYFLGNRNTTNYVTRNKQDTKAIIEYWFLICLRIQIYIHRFSLSGCLRMVPGSGVQ